MNLKEKIESDFKEAFKNKDEVRKKALRNLKSKITETEKNNGNNPLSEESILKVITSAVKQRNQSIEEFGKGNRKDLVDNERAELSVIEVYLPSQLTEEEIKQKITEILLETGLESEQNRQKKIGQLMGNFNKKYTGRFDNKKLKEILEKVI